MPPLFPSEALPFTFSSVRLSPMDVILEAERRTDPVSSAGGGTELCRTRLRGSHHISTLKIVHCRQPLSISGHYTRRKEGEQTTKRWKQSLLGFPEFLSEAASECRWMRTHTQSGHQELDQTSPWTQAHQAGNPLRSRSDF